VAKLCGTLTFPALVLLDTLKAAAFDIKTTTMKPDTKRDMLIAREFKQNRKVEEILEISNID